MKTILVTGGGRGLGKATAQALVTLGHRVILTARTEDAATDAAASFTAGASGLKGHVDAMALDLSSLSSVRRFSRYLTDQRVTIDVLLNCAGVMQQSVARRVTTDGFEETLAVNTLAPFALTLTLWPALLRSAAPRVVNVTSRLHLPGSRGASVDFDFDDPQLERGYGPERAYKNSKLALLWWTYELNRRRGVHPITVNAVCPGFVPATAAQSVTGFQRFLLRRVLPMMPFARSIEQAVASFVFMATDPSLDGVSGGFYGECKALRSSPESYDEAKAAKFWAWAESVTGVSLP